MTSSLAGSTCETDPLYRSESHSAFGAAAGAVDSVHRLEQCAHGTLLGCPGRAPSGSQAQRGSDSEVIPFAASRGVGQHVPDLSPGGSDIDVGHEDDARDVLVSVGAGAAVSARAMPTSRSSPPTGEVDDEAADEWFEAAVDVRTEGKPSCRVDWDKTVEDVAERPDRVD